MERLKMTDWKMRHQNAGVKYVGPMKYGNFGKLTNARHIFHTHILCKYTCSLYAKCHHYFLCNSRSTYK